MTGDSWLEIPDDAPFGLSTLPYGLVGGRVVVAVGDRVLDLAAAADDLLSQRAAWFEGDLSRFLAAGRPVWQEVREAVTTWLTEARYRPVVEPLLQPAAEPALPFPVADYVDFYGSEHHASNAGRIFRPQAEPLYPNWWSMPVGYHGRAGTVVVSGTPVRRPVGQVRTADGVATAPSARLDVEAEVGFVVGVPSVQGERVAVEEFEEHVFGVVLVNDWSARDVQAWETLPLGPFLGKSFATSMSGWVVPLEALEGARVQPPDRPEPAQPYLQQAEPWGLDLTLGLSINGTTVSRPPYALHAWTAPQMLAHLTVGGASVRTGDLYASGTVSGPEREHRGCLLELTWNGRDGLTLDDGTTRTWLEDGDEVVITAGAPGGVRLGEVRGRVLPARPR